MGLDEDHMTYDRLAQAIPPSYTRLITGQACMSEAHARFGVPVVTYDEHVADPAGSRRLLASWLRGAGDDSADAGMRFVSGHECSSCEDEHAPDLGRDEPVSYESDNGSAAVPGESEDAFRELYYSHVGGFDRIRAPDAERAWLHRLRPNVVLGDGHQPEELIGANTFIKVSWHQTADVQFRASGDDRSWAILVHDGRLRRLSRADGELEHARCGRRAGMLLDTVLVQQARVVSLHAGIQCSEIGPPSLGHVGANHSPHRAQGS